VLPAAGSFRRRRASERTPLISAESLEVAGVLVVESPLSLIAFSLSEEKKKRPYLQIVDSLGQVL
jgi:hypothetical protein